MHPESVFHPTAKNLESYTDPDAALARIIDIYERNAQIIQGAFRCLVEGTGQDESIAIQEATYPYVGIRVETKDLNLDARLSFGVAAETGVYGGTVTRPDIFKSYYREQIQLLIERHKVPVVVGESQAAIPLPFVVEHSPAQLAQEQLWQLQTGFCLPNLSRIDDTVVNCTYQPPLNHSKPIALFSGERVDYSLHRLHHYTGTAPEHFQHFVLLTNYQRYSEEFINFSMEQLKKKEGYTALVAPGNVIRLHQENGGKVYGTSPHYLPQMPAYHLKRPDGQGITFINIGIGPSNAKNITDHLAVLRPHCWLMLGHCAGLRSSQLLGDYVLAHGYVREDHVLDQDLPIWIPVPPIAEVQVALQQAVTNVFAHQQGVESKIEMRTGTVVTTDNRNWELRSRELYERFNQSRAIALDMESATVAANGFRFRVPYGTLLCVSDKPIHGEIKLRGMANIFYQERVNQHLKIGLEAVRLLRDQIYQLHSRKLRGFNEPPFR